MQVTFNSYKNNQNFGMSLNINSKTRNFLNKKLSARKLEQIDKLVKSQQNNPVHVDINAYRNQYLTGKIYDNKYICEYTIEGVIDQMLNKHSGFIKKMCKKADNYKKEFHTI